MWVGEGGRHLTLFALHEPLTMLQRMVNYFTQFDWGDLHLRQLQWTLAPWSSQF